jgi:hypothetical protein
MNKRERELRQEVQRLAEAQGGRLLKVEMTGGHHYRLTLKRRDGSTFNFIMAFSPSDYRSSRNALAQLRRYFK